jgi:chemotaxis protein CheY-P-specific phosphatase CheC
MKVENLVIERKQSYDTDYPNMLVGLVQIKGEHGKMEVKLSSLVVGKIFALIKDDVQKVADYNSSQASDAVSEAENETPLLAKSDLPDDPF